MDLRRVRIGHRLDRPTLGAAQEPRKQKYSQHKRYRSTGLEPVNSAKGLSRRNEILIVPRPKATTAEAYRASGGGKPLVHGSETYRTSAAPSTDGDTVRPSDHSSMRTAT